jgi:Transglycosylase SLT domain
MTPHARDSVGGLGMRPIIGLAILLVGLQGGAPGGAPESKYEDRVPAAQESAVSSILETRTDIADSGIVGSIAESRKPETETPETPEADTPETDTPEIATLERNDENREFVVASLDVGALEAGHRAEEVIRSIESPAIAMTDPVTDADADATDDDVRESIDGLCTALLTSAQDNDLPVPFFANLIWQESELQRDAVSRVGALGIAQFMPTAAVETGLADPFDPHQAIPASARLLRTLRQHFGNLGLAAAAYNAGAHRVGQWIDHHRPLPRETRNYVRRITGRSVEAWRKSARDDDKLAFMRPLPCRKMPAFAELEQVPPMDARQEPEKTAGRRGTGRLAQKGARGMMAPTHHFAERKTVRRLTAATQATTIAREVRGGNHDAMRRHQHVLHERRRMAQAIIPAPTP